ncbi:MAG: hypothetical protein WCW67_07350 [Candidatus Margulisiibacteriota bacterium]|jgi:hypothetical protein
MISRSAKLTQYALAGIVVGALLGGCKKTMAKPTPQPAASSVTIRDPQKLYLQDWQIKMLLTSREYRGGELCVDGLPVDFQLEERINQCSQMSFYDAGARELLVAAKGNDFLSLSEEKQRTAVNYLAGKIIAVGPAQDHSFSRLLSEADRTGHRNYCQDNSRPFSFLVDLNLPASEMDLALVAAAAIKTEYQLIITEPLALPVPARPESEKSLTLAFRVVNGRRPDVSRLSVDLGGQGVAAKIEGFSGGGRGIKIDHCLIDEDELIIKIRIKLERNAALGRRDLALFEDQTPLLLVKNALVVVPPPGAELPNCTSLFSAEDRHKGLCK